MMNTHTSCIMGSFTSKYSHEEIHKEEADHNHYIIHKLLSKEREQSRCKEINQLKTIKGTHNKWPLTTVALENSCL
jgi:hypothetical protein